MSSRLKYLRALDIDVWQPRTPLGLAAPVADAAPGMDLDPSPRSEAMPAFAGDGVEIRPPQTEPPVQIAAAPETAAVAGATSRLGWAELEQRVRQCTACELHRTRTRPVFGVGNVRAQWMVIGEAPGADEDRQGEPFVGRAGQLLNSMLKAMGLQREQVYIANILKSRAPGNRDPKADEVAACIPYLYRQIELVNPHLLLCVGRIAAQTLLNTETPIGKLRGKLHAIDTGGSSSRPMIVTYHPAYLLRSPVEKRKAWADLVLAMQTFEKIAQAREPGGVASL